MLPSLFPPARSAFRPRARACSRLTFGLLGAVLGNALAASPAAAAAADSWAVRRHFSLSGEWLFQTNGAPDHAWKPVLIPSSFETHEGLEFDGVGWYRRTVLPPALAPGERLLLHFQAAATDTEVWWDGQRLGRHLGGWTPFRFDVTELVRATAPRTHELRVRVDEKVGHNTQGFLPIVQPHFGGLWQDVAWLVVPDPYLDDLELRATGNPVSRHLELELPLRGRLEPWCTNVTVRTRLRGTSDWTAWSPASAPPAPSPDPGPRLSLEPPPAGATSATRGTLSVAVPIAQPRVWSPAEPHLYEVEITLPRPAGAGPGADRIRTRAAFRTIEARGHQLRLNGHPLQVRGLLNWGYYPPRLAPHPPEDVMRQDLEFLRARGFNLLKFCLWVPPKRFLELADELGVLTWMEYPTWHPQLTPQHLEPLRREFTEFFQYDRNHPSVILRSLTCETGPGADLEVIRALYNQAHRLIPGAVIEDDSSWIEWNRVSDFYDDHPYGNNHTWVATLARLQAYIAAREPKPLLLGEAIAADTWVPAAPYAAIPAPERSYAFPGAFDAQRQWETRLAPLAGADAVARLLPDSLRYALAMRKYQAETFRREVPHGGYVISVIRDIRTASMGLIDYAGAPKSTPADWAWQRDTLALLRTEDDRRSFAGGESLRGEILLSHFGPAPLTNAELRLTLHATPRPDRALAPLERSGFAQACGTVEPRLAMDWPLPDVETPTPLELRAEIRSPQGAFTNAWPLWLVPAVPATAATPVFRHPSLPEDLAQELFPSARPASDQVTAGIIVAARFDDALVRALEAGARVLLLPDGERGSFPLAEHWFLRGAPMVAGHRLSSGPARDLLVDLQAFDLASRVIPNLTCLEQIDPILLLWDTHDLRTVKTHGLLFETGAGRGRLLVSALRHTGRGNAAGRWWLARLLADLAQDTPPARRLTDAQWRRIQEKLHEHKLALADRPWRFRPDPQGEGVERGWQSADLPEDGAWTEIKVGQHWEGQGFPALDRWAWYRLKVTIPAAWSQRRTYLSFEGVDDCYELFVNGRLVARRGDIATRVDTFNEKFSHDLTGFVEPGQDALIAVRVYDWYGAGGIFRPVTLGTAPLAPESDLLQ